VSCEFKYKIVVISQYVFVGKNMLKISYIKCMKVSISVPLTP
jgi:hypothetical protein